MKKIYMGGEMRSCELRILSLDKPSEDIKSWPELPAVCLIATERMLETEMLGKIVYDIPSCELFAVCGKYASEIEDEIDYVLMGRDEDDIFAVTTAHPDETMDDVAFFVIYAFLLEKKKFRCIVFIDDAFSQKDLLIHALHENLKLLDKPEE